MDQSPAVHNTFVIERTYRKPLQQVFSAFSDPAKKRRWFIDGENYEVEAFDLDFRVGGAECTRYRFKEGTPFPGVILATEGTICDIVPNGRIVTSSTMSLGDKRISSSLVTFQFLPDEKGTNLTCTHQAVFFEGADGPEMRQGGWRYLLDRLEKQLDG